LTDITVSPGVNNKRSGF